MPTKRSLNGWQRLWVVAAVIWAIIVVADCATKLQGPTAAEVTAEWARAKVELFRKHHGADESYEEFRAKFYGNALDEEIVSPRGQSGGRFDPNRAVPADEMDVIDGQYRPLLVGATQQSRGDVLLRALMIWMIPAALLYLTGIIVQWVLAGFRQQ